MCFSDEQAPGTGSTWMVEMIKTVKDLPVDAEIVLKYVGDPEIDGVKGLDADAMQKVWRRGLAGRVLAPKTVAIVSLLVGNDDDDHPSFCPCVVVVQEIRGLPEQELTDDPTSLRAFRVGSILDSFRVTVTSTTSCEDNSTKSIESPRHHNQKQPWAVDCPGYLPIVETLLALVLHTAPPVSPTGILLDGCSGVGKTRLISCVAGRIR